MQVRVAALWHVIVHHDVHAFDVNAASEEVCGDHDSLFKVFKLLIAVDSAQEGRHSDSATAAQLR